MYLPKDLNLKAKFSASMTSSNVSAAVAATHESDRKVDGIKFKEKRLDIRIWRCEGTIRKVAISRSVSSRTMSAADRLRSWRSADKDKCRDNGKVRSGGPKAQLSLVSNLRKCS